MVILRYSCYIYIWYLLKGCYVNYVINANKAAAIELAVLGFDCILENEGFHPFVMFVSDSEFLGEGGFLTFIVNPFLLLIVIKCPKSSGVRCASHFLYSPNWQFENVASQISLLFLSIYQLLKG